MKRAAWIMVNHNGGEELLSTIDSLSRDLSSGDTIILVDNGSEDGSAVNAKSRYQKVQLLKNDNNLPFSAATNRGLAAALEQGYSWIGIINPDVRISPGMTEELIRTLEAGKAERIGAVSPVMTFRGTERIWFAGGMILWPLEWTQHRGMGKHFGNAYRYRGTTSYLTGCCWLSPAQVWRDVGLLDEDYVFYAEDADWSIRARKAEWRLYVQSNTLLEHNVSSSTGGKYSPVKMFYRTVMGRRFFSRHTPPSVRPLQWIGAPLMHFVYSAYLILTGNTRALKIYHQALKIKPTELVKWPPSREQIISSS
ncbi:MAG: glycosyltransferase family 2 protein [bacterium]